MTENNKQGNSICNKCNSFSYCANKSKGVTSCINFNKFPKENGSDRYTR